MKAYCNCGLLNPCGHVGCPDCDPTCDWEECHEAEYDEEDNSDN